MAEEILRIAPDQVKKLIKQGKIEIVSTTSAVSRKPESGSSFEFSQGLFELDFFGPRDVEKVFGLKIAPENVPQIPFSQVELEAAKSLDQKLILRVDRAPDAKPLTMRKMEQLLQPKFKAAGSGKVLFDTTWYKNEDFFTKQTPTYRWALTGKSALPDTLGKNYLEQTVELSGYVARDLFPGGIPIDYQEALNEFAVRVPISLSSPDAAQKLAAFKLNQMLRPSAVEALYDLLITFQTKGERTLENEWAWTNTRASGGRLVGVGYFNSAGVDVRRLSPDDSYSDLGVCPSR